MARGQRIPIEDKIQQKEELIESLESRLQRERDELEALYSQQKQKEVEILYDFIKTSGLSVNEVIEVLEQYVTEKYGETA